MQRRFANAFLKDDRVSILYALALMQEVAKLLLVAQLFASPQRAGRRSLRICPDNEVILQRHDVVVGSVVAQMFFV